MALKTAWHRNRDIPWSANDIYDIDAMALAVPYCDVVVTEKACPPCSGLNRHGCAYEHSTAPGFTEPRVNTQYLGEGLRLLPVRKPFSRSQSVTRDIL